MQGKFVGKGAEAVLERSDFLGLDAVVKTREPKAYRNPALDVKLRKARTKSEARLISRAKSAGVRCPTVLEVSDFAIGMTFEKGRMMHELLQEGNCPKSAVPEAGRMLAALHSANVVHGDFTPANIIVGEKGKLILIDFGLGGFSTDSEDKAVDVLTMKKALGKLAPRFVAAYARHGNKKICEKAEEIGKRARYQERA
jgi:N6-L-threonylcarbamoyladenine synthase/protein kinase Bud32